MMRGADPIVVSAVLLIAITAIATIAVYFWAAGQAPVNIKQSSPVTIDVQPINPTLGTYLVQNMDPKRSVTLSQLQTTTGETCPFDNSPVTLGPNDQATCTLDVPREGDITFYAPSVTAATVIVGGAFASFDFDLGTGFTMESTVHSLAGDFASGFYKNTTWGSVFLANGSFKKNDVITRRPLNDYTPEVEFGTDAARTIHVVWSGYKPTAVGGVWEVFYSNSTPGIGLPGNWSWVMITNYDIKIDIEPQLAVNSTNAVHVLFEKNTTPGGGPFAIHTANSEKNFSNLAAPVIYTDKCNTRLAPRMAIDSNNVIHVCFVGSTMPGCPVGRDLYYMNSTTGPWAPVLVYMNPATESLECDIATGPDNSWHIVWTEGFGGGLELRYTNSSLAAPWGRVNGTRAAVVWQQPRIRVDSNKIAHLVWNNQSAGSEVDYANSTYNFSYKVLDNALADHPELDINSTNAVHAAWDSSANTIKYGTSANNWANVVVEPNLSPPWGRMSPDIAEYKGDIFIPWQDHRDGVQDDVWYQRWTSGYLPWGFYWSGFINTTLVPAKKIWLNWANTTPDGANFSMWFRVGNATGAAFVNVTDGSWRRYPTPNTLSTDTGEYIQYNASFVTSRSWETPVLASVNVSYLAANASVTYTVDYENGLSWVAVERDCGGGWGLHPGGNDTGLGGMAHYVNNTWVLSTTCSYRVKAGGSDGKLLGPENMA
jgi:hypothetical protein